MLIEAIFEIFPLIAQDIDGLLLGSWGGGGGEVNGKEGSYIQVDDDALIGGKDDMLLAGQLIADHLYAHQYRLP